MASLPLFSFPRVRLDHAHDRLWDLRDEEARLVGALQATQAASENAAAEERGLAATAEELEKRAVRIHAFVCGYHESGVGCGGVGLWERHTRGGLRGGW